MPQLAVRSLATQDEVRPDARAAAVVRPVVEFARALNAGDLDQAIAQLAPDARHDCGFRHHTPVGVRALLTRLRSVFPDLHLEIQDLRIEDSRVSSIVVLTGTHLGPFLGRPPSGRWMTWKTPDRAEVELVRLVGSEQDVDSRIVRRSWDVWRSPELFRQLGFVPGAS